MTPPSRLLAAAKAVFADTRYDFNWHTEHVELRAAILEAEQEPEVERVEVPRYIATVGSYRSEGFRIYAERLIPPMPKEPTLSERCRSLAGDDLCTTEVFLRAQVASRNRLLREAADRLEGK